MKQNIIQNIVNWLVILLLILAFLIPGSSMWKEYVSEQYADVVHVLDTGWTWNGDAVESLAEYNGTADENNEIHLSTTLTEDMVLERDGVILFRSAQQTLNVYVGDALIYVYDPLDTQFFGSLAPSQWHYVPLSSGQVGEEITFVTHSALAQYADNMQTIRYGTSDVLRDWVFGSYFPTFLANIFLISTGLLLFMVTLFPKKVEWMRLAGLFTITMGIWGIGESEFTEFLFFGNYIWNILTFEAILFGIYFYTAFICNFIKKHITHFRLWIEYVALGNLILQNILYWTGAYEFIEMLFLNHILVFAIVGVNLYYTIRYRQVWLIEKINIKHVVYVQGIYFAGVLIEVWQYLVGNISNTGYIFRIGISAYIISIVGLSMQVLLERMAETNRLSEELLQYRVAIAKSQIKPHFIFNTLTSIRSLIKIDPEEAYHLVGMFSKYLRVNMNSFEKNEMVPFAKEVDHIRTYVEIEQVRFGKKRVSVVYDLRETAFLVPALSIQPIVENAIKHGICKKAGGGVVTLRSYEMKNDYVIEVIDTGVGFDVKAMEENIGKQTESIGITNVRFRLHTLVHAKVNAKSIIGKGSKIQIVIPKELRK